MIYYTFLSKKVKKYVKVNGCTVNRLKNLFTTVTLLILQTLATRWRPRQRVTALELVRHLSLSQSLVSPCSPSMEAEWIQCQRQCSHVHLVSNWLTNKSVKDIYASHHMEEPPTDPPTDPWHKVRSDLATSSDEDYKDPTCDPP